MIQIENLTERQKSIMELLWTCRDQDQVMTLIRSLPTLKDQRDACSLVDVATWETLEQQGALKDYEQITKDLISRVSSL